MVQDRMKIRRVRATLKSPFIQVVRASWLLTIRNSPPTGSDQTLYWVHSEERLLIRIRCQNHENFEVP